LNQKFNIEENVFSERELNKALHDTLRQAAWYMDSYQQWQISQSHCEISGNCGKIIICASRDVKCFEIGGIIVSQEQDADCDFFKESEVKERV